MPTLNMETKIRVFDIVDSIGKENYLRMIGSLNKNINMVISDTRNHPRNLASNLHQLKGQCYTVGFQTLGKHINNLENTAVHGAHMTVYAHLEEIHEAILAHIDSVQTYLDEDIDITSKE